MSVEATIQRVRDGIISDLLKLVKKYEPLRAFDPQQYIKNVEEDIGLYLDVIKSQPTMQEFFSLCKVDQEVFIREISDVVMTMLLAPFS